MSCHDVFFGAEKVRNVTKRGEFMGKKTPQQELLFAEEKVLIHVRHLIAGKKSNKTFGLLVSTHFRTAGRNRRGREKKTLLIFCLDEGTPDALLIIAAAGCSLVILVQINRSKIGTSAN